MFVLRTIAWVVSIGAAVVACLILAIGLAVSKSSIQESAFVGYALCAAVIPHCVARAIHEIGRP